MSMLLDCQHLSDCGGCSSPQTRYHDSLKIKDTHLRDLFSPLFPRDAILPVIPCSPLLYGRNKMEFSFYQTREGEKTLGFITPSKPRQGITITNCLMIHEDAMHLLERTRTWWNQHPELMAYYPPFNKGSLCTLTVRIGSPTHHIMVILTTSARKEYAVSPLLIEEWKSSLLQSGLPISSIVWEEKVCEKTIPTYFHTHLLHGDPFITQQLTLPKDGRSATFRVYARSFFQPQLLQNARIIETAKEFIDPNGSEVLLDLYCGSGTIGIMLSSYVKKVIGVEIIPDAVASARENILLNNKEHLVEVHLASVKTFCKDLQETPEIAIIDPPRCGMQNKALKYLLRIFPQKILYISCNPKVQFEECCVLIEAGYCIKKMQPLDQFPHSPHLENIILLERKNMP